MSCFRQFTCLFSLPLVQQISYFYDNKVLLILIHSYEPVLWIVGVLWTQCQEVGESPFALRDQFLLSHTLKKNKVKQTYVSDITFWMPVCSIKYVLPCPWLDLLKSEGSSFLLYKIVTNFLYDIKENRVFYYRCNNYVAKEVWFLVTVWAWHHKHSH